MHQWLVEVTLGLPSYPKSLSCACSRSDSKFVYFICMHLLFMRAFLGTLKYILGLGKPDGDCFAF